MPDWTDELKQVWAEALGQTMRQQVITPIPVRHSKRTDPEPWHLTAAEWRDGQILEGYRVWCGGDIKASDAVLQPNRHEGICSDCFRVLAEANAP